MAGHFSSAFQAVVSLSFVFGSLTPFFIWEYMGKISPCQDSSALTGDGKKNSKIRIKPPCPAFGGVAPPNMKIELDKRRILFSY
ncbi:MAG: hypothetical protein C0407_07355 [Desulfobacca sp.]|nr:hypothetical protein [Desulfobacca sp.]